MIEAAERSLSTAEDWTGRCCADEASMMGVKSPSILSSGVLERCLSPANVLRIPSCVMRASLKVAISEVGQYPGLVHRLPLAMEARLSALRERSASMGHTWQHPAIADNTGAF